MIKNVCVFLVVLLSLIFFLIRQLFKFCCFFSLLKVLWVFSRFLLISHGSCQLSSDVCKHFKVLKWPSVLHPYVFWADYLLSVQKYLVFSAFGKGCLCLLKMFLSICRLYFIQFLHEIYMEKVLQELVWVPFWVPIPFKWYQNTSGCGTDHGQIFMTFWESQKMLLLVKSKYIRSKWC